MFSVKTDKKHSHLQLLNYTSNQNFASILANLLLTSTLFKKHTINLFGSTNTPKITSLYNLQFILPVYGFLFLTSYYGKENNQTRLLTIQKYSFLYLNDFKKLLFGKFNKINTFNKFFFTQHK